MGRRLEKVMIFNHRCARAGGLRYLSCVLCVCLCVSITTLASTLFVSTFQVRYIHIGCALGRYSIGPSGC